MASSQKPKGHNIDEDVDDLDDLIEEFSAQPVKPAAVSQQSRSQLPPPKPSVVQEPPQGASSSASGSRSPTAPDAFSDEFAQEFAKGMESLLKEIGDPSMFGTGGEESTEGEKESAFKAAWESMFMESVAGTGAEGSKPSSQTTASLQSGSAEDSFQSRINMTMDKLKETASTLKADSGATPDMESLFSELGKMGEGGEGDDDLQGLLETMMTQLMSKEVLYEPLKELYDKFPSYLTENASKLSEADKKRYQSQQECATKIIAVFESPKYSEDDPEVGVQIVALMTEMQAYGAPPAEIMGDLPPGMGLGPDGLPQLPEGCTLM